MALHPGIVDLTRSLALDVAQRLRARDRVEVLALMPAGLADDDALMLWVGHILSGGVSWAAVVDGVPVAMGGLRELEGRPDVAHSWCVGTDRKLEAGAIIFRHAARMHEAWEARGVRRFQCSCLDSPEESSAWLERLGYEREGRLRALGRGGEDFIIWGRIHGR